MRTVDTPTLKSAKALYPSFGRLHGLQNDAMPTKQEGGGGGSNQGLTTKWRFLVSGLYQECPGPVCFVLTQTKLWTGHRRDLLVPDLTSGALLERESLVDEVQCMITN